MAALALVVSLFTYWIRRHWVNEPLLALLLGVLIGPEGLGWLDLAEFGDEREMVEVAARLTLAIALVSVGLEVRGYLRLVPTGHGLSQGMRDKRGMANRNVPNGGGTGTDSSVLSPCASTRTSGAVPPDAGHLRRRGEAGKEHRDRHQDAEYQHGSAQ